METLPCVAVVIPLYDGAQWTEATLDAVLGQTHRPREIVVVDNGSSDDGPDRAAAYPDVRLMRYAEPGTDLALQAGLVQTTAPLVAFLDQDDLRHPDHLRPLATALARHPDAVAAVDATGSFPDGHRPALDPPALDLEAVDPWDVYPGCFTPTPSARAPRRTTAQS